MDLENALAKYKAALCDPASLSRWDYTLLKYTRREFVEAQAVELELLGVGYNKDWLEEGYGSLGWENIRALLFASVPDSGWFCDDYLQIAARCYETEKDEPEIQDDIDL